MGVEAIDCEYPAIHDSNRVPIHFIGASHAFSSERLGMEVKLTEFKGYVHLAWT